MISTLALMLVTALSVPSAAVPAAPTLGAAPSPAAPPATVPNGLDGLDFLLGQWEGVGGGAPGAGTGGFTFSRDLQGKVLVRRNHADYPATAQRPAAFHDDLMVIYGRPAGGPARAVYFDTEGHVIDYTVQVTAGRPALIVFVSDPAAGSPTFRLTYRETGADSLGLTFEIAPPGQPQAFSTYIEAKARRVQH
jgi:hypothetical protein